MYMMGQNWVGMASRRSFSIICLVFFSFLSVAVQAAPKAKAIEFWDDSEESTRFDVDHSSWDAILKKYVLSHSSGINRFAYEAVSEADKTNLKNYLDAVQSMDPRQLAKASQKAYWLNLFNAGLVLQVLESKPEESIKEVSNNRLWRKKRFYIALQKLSLDNVEHGILRPIFNDPRIHFAIASGTLGSANILNTAFTAENTERLLEMNTRDFLSHPRGVGSKNGKLVLSSIFKWYQSDFGGGFAGVKAFLKQHLPSDKMDLVNSASSANYEYDWQLNKPAPSAIAAD